MKSKFIVLCAFICMIIQIPATSFAQEGDFTGIWNCRAIFHYSNVPFGRDQKFRCKLHLYKVGSKYLAVLIAKNGYNISIGNKVPGKVVFDNSTIKPNGSGGLQMHEVWVDINDNIVGSVQKTGTWPAGELIMGRHRPTDGKYDDLVKKYLLHTK